MRTRALFKADFLLSGAVVRKEDLSARELLLCALVWSQHQGQEKKKRKEEAAEEAASLLSPLFNFTLSSRGDALERMTHKVL